MQSSGKETAANMAASAKAAMERAKATVQEKAERMTTSDPLQKEMAEKKKEHKIHEAEREKHEARVVEDPAIISPLGVRAHEARVEDPATISPPDVGAQPRATH